MNTLKRHTGKLLVASVVLAVLSLSSCTPDLQDDPIPFVPFSPIQITLAFPQYASLNTDGGSYYIGNGGVRGIIVYRKNASTYFAYESNCSFRPNEACANVQVNATTLFMEDVCCGSTFDFSSGMPTGGPAWRPLRRYETLLSGGQLTITDEIAE